MCWSLAHAVKYKREVREGGLDFKQILATVEWPKEIYLLTLNLGHVEMPCWSVYEQQLARRP